MLNHSAHPVVRRAALGELHKLTPGMLFRAPSKGSAKRAATQVKTRRSTDALHDSLIAAVSRVIADDRNQAASIGGFTASVVDRTPALLDDSYRLRHQVYCNERQFLAAADYPDGLESDELDASSVHVGAIDDS